MARIYQILLALSVVVLAIVFFYKFAEKNGVNKCELKHQEIELKQQDKQIEYQHETIEVKKYQQKIISKTAANVDADSRRKFLLLVFKERANPNG